MASRRDEQREWEDEQWRSKKCSIADSSLAPHMDSALPCHSTVTFALNRSVSLSLSGDRQQGEGNLCNLS